MALRKPEIDYTASTALRDLISLAAHYVDKDLDRKARLRAENLTLAKEEYNFAQNELRALNKDYSLVSTKYQSLLGKVPKIESTDNSKALKNNLLDWYTDTTFQIKNKMGHMESNMSSMSQDILDIERVKAGLTKSISPAKGKPNIYDKPDFATDVLSDTFGVEADVIDKFKAKQKEAIPTAIISLNKMLKEAKLSELKKLKEGGDESLEKLGEQISSRVVNSPYMKAFRNIAAADLNKEEMTDLILKIGEEEELPVSRLLAPEHQVLTDEYGNEIEDKKTVKAKKAKQYEIMFNLYSTFESFKGKEGTKDIMGLGRFVQLADEQYGKLKPEHKPPFKAYIEKVFNIDLDASGDFILPGFTLSKEGKREESIFDIRDFDNLPVYDQLAAFIRASQMTKGEYFDDEDRRASIKNLYSSRFPNLSEKELTIKIQEDYKLL